MADDFANPHKTLEAAKADRKALDTRLSAMRAELETTTDSKRVRFLRDEIAADERRLAMADRTVELSALIIQDQSEKFEAKKADAIKATPGTLQEVERLMGQADAAFADAAAALDEALEKLAGLHPVCNREDARRILSKSIVTDAAIAAGLHLWLPLPAIVGQTKPNLKSVFPVNIRETVMREAERLANMAKQEVEA